MTVAQDVTDIKNLIQDEVDVQNQRATDAISDSKSFLDALANEAFFNTPAVNLPNITTSIVAAFLSAIAPERPTAAIATIKAEIPTEPGDFEATVTDRAIQDAPQEQFNSPTIEFPTAPTFEKETKPSSPDINLPVGAPAKPVLTVPSDLTVSTQSVPNIPSVSLPNWGETIPTLSISLPSTTLAYVEPVYTSVLKDAITAGLLSGVQNGGTGLNATIEGDIWNRDVERLAQVLSDNIDDTINRFSGRGFTMPPGTVAAQVQELQINHTNDRSQQSRDVAIEQARIAKEMTQYFLTTGLSLEQIELNHANNVANRALEAEKSVVEFSIALFNSNISLFNADLSRYQAKAVETENLIRIENLKLDQYRAELAGVEAEATKDRVSIENYRAKLTAHDAVVRLYEAEISATIAAMNIERAKIEIFKSEIDAYIANINAQRNEYDLFLAQIQGEKAKVELYQSEIEAYISRVNAVKVSNDVVIEKIKSDIAVEDLNLRAHLANVEIWTQKVLVALRELGVEESFYTADIRKFGEQVRQEGVQGELNLAVVSKGIEINQNEKELALTASINNMNAVIEAAKARTQAAAHGSAAYAAMATAAIASIQSLLQLGGQGTSEETASE